MMSPKASSMQVNAVVVPASLVRMQRVGFSNYWYYSTFVTSPASSDIFITNAPTAAPALFNVTWNVPGELFASSNLLNWARVQMPILCVANLTNSTQNFVRVPIDLATGVTMLGNSSIGFSWDYPDRQAQGFNIYQGGNSKQYTNRISFGDVRGATVKNLQTNVWYYFAISAVNLAGIESTNSNEIAIMLNGSGPLINVDLKIK